MAGSMVLSRLAVLNRDHPMALPAAFLLVLWLQLFVALTPFWSLGTYYDYGWIVPFASGWFFWKRWARLTASSTPVSSSRVDVAGVALIALFIGLLLPLRVVERADLFWRPPRLLHATLVCLMHHAILARFLGWKKSAYFVPVTIFCLTAVPLPMQLEQGIIQRATKILMTVAEPLCQQQGLPVKLSGSALTLDGVVLEIEEGCSGIRSIQSLWMIALFAGEFFLLGGFSRVVLVLLGLGLAFVFNIARAVVLTHIFFRSGEDPFHSWHDTVGSTTFALSALALWGVACLLKQFSRQRGSGTSQEQRARPLSPDPLKPGET